MKMFVRKFFSVQSMALVAVLLCFVPFDTVQGATGMCQGRYEVVVTHVNGRPMSKVIPFGEFQSYGKGRAVPRATRRAKKNAERCMQSQWYGRQHPMIPYECQDQGSISGYYIQDFQKTLKKEICKALKPLSCDRERAEVRYSLYAVVDGGSGCGTRQSPVSRTLLGSDLTVQCKCRQPLKAPRKQVAPARGTTFYHFPRRTLVAWQPVQRAQGYVVEVRHNGRLWTTLNSNGEATFVMFDFPGVGQGEWRVTAQGRRGMNSPASPWFSFNYQR